MKLKTLKDIEEIGSEAHKINGSCYKQDVKAEAIKWIKCKRGKDYRMTKKDKIGHEYQVGWIKHFFNITEEDLK